MVQESHLNGAVTCGRCNRPFMVRAPAAVAPAASWTPSPSREEDMTKSDNDVVLDWDAPGASAYMGQGQGVTQPAPALTTTNIRLDVAGYTHPGRVRPRNEDSFLVQSLSWCNVDQRHDLSLVVVADGVGGYEAGDQASGLLIRIVGNTLAPLMTGFLTGMHKEVTPAQIAQTIDTALQSANRVIFQRAQTSPNCRGMASTASVVLIWDGQVYIGHVGDTRVYHYRSHQLTQVTRDQTLLARMIELGQITPREAANHPARNEVAQAVGKHTELAPAGYQLRLAPGDTLLVACDGLHTHVDARMLDGALRQPPPAAWMMAHQLVELANVHGGSDNITVVAVRCS
jgi:PPM family protein phosphatase